MTKRKRSFGEKALAALVIVAWALLWIPISSYFPAHAGYPFPAFPVPVLFVLLLPFVGSARSLFVYVVLPTGFFWGVLGLALWLLRAFLDKLHTRRGGGHEV